jgi:hypothetical protein
MRGLIRDLVASIEEHGLIRLSGSAIATAGRSPARRRSRRQDEKAVLLLARKPPMSVGRRGRTGT